ncbi:hypothetical protein EON64_00055 [archaeon]|nr:MAG: hypothetical protein EON64_00055 [archaeon]
MQCVSQAASPLEADDDEPHQQTALEKITQLSAAASVLQPLLDFLKQSNNALYSLVASFQVNDSTAPKSRHRGGRKERKEKVRRDNASGMGGKSPSELSATSHLTALDKVALCVAKGIGEGSAASLLSAVAALFVLMKDSDSMSSEPPTLAVGNLVASLFAEPEHGSDSADHEPLRNPFQLYLQASKRPRSSSVANSEESRGDLSSAEDSRDESTSQPGTFGAAASDAGSTIGSMFAELGTETMSIMGDEPSEDDVLAQALALSMAENFPGHNAQAEEGYVARADKDLSSELETAVQDSICYAETCLPFASPLASLGMLAKQDFWTSLYSGSAVVKRLHNNLLPAKHTVVALLTALCIAVDQTCDEKCLTTEDSGSGGVAALNVAIHIKLDSSAEAFSMCEFLVEHLKAALAQHSYAFDAAKRDTDASQWHSHHHFLSWTLHSTLKVLKGLFHSVGSDRSVATMLFRSPVPTESELLSGIGGLRNSMSRLRLHVLDISGLYNTGIGESVRLFEMKYPVALTQQHEINLMNYEDSIASRTTVEHGSLNCLHSLSYLSHTLRLMAIEVIASSIRIFLPDGMARLKLLDTYLSVCPHCPPELQSYGTAQYIEKMLLLPDTSTCSTVWPESWYENYYLQALCLYVVKADECLDQFLHVIQSSSASKCLTSVNRALQDSLGKKDKLQVLKSLHRRLLHRLSSKGATKGSPLLQYGVVTTGLCLQLFFMESCNVLYGSNLGQCDFSSVKIHPCLSLSRDMKTVLHSGPKLWASVLSTTSLKPNCGVFEWAVQVDRCTKGHVFLGIASQEAGTSSNFTDAYYVGVDKHSWGLIGTRSLWHNKSKVIADFGSGFSTGSVVLMRYNSDAGTLSYKTQDSEWAVAFESLPKVPMFPAFSLHENGDQLSLLYCEKIEGSERKDRVADSALNIQYIRDGTASIVTDVFTNYAIELLSTVDSLMLDEIQAGADLVNNPVIGTWLSSLLGFFVSTKSAVPRSLLINILPLMLVVARRLVHISEKSREGLVDMSHQLEGERPLNESCSLVGDWITFTFSGIVGGNMQGTSTLHITKESSLDTFIANSHEMASRDGLGRIVSSCSMLSGTTKTTFGSLGAYSLSGYRLEEKVKLVEKTASSAVKTWDAKLSLCGGFMIGNFHDDKASKFQFFEAFRRHTSDCRVSCVSRVAIVCANLAVAAASRFSALLTTLLNSDEQSKAPIGGEQLEEEDSDGERSQSDPAGEEFAPLVKSGTFDGDDNKPDMRGEEEASETVHLQYWLRSNLLRCGLKFSDRVAEEVRQLVSRKIPLALIVDDFGAADEKSEGKFTNSDNSSETLYKVEWLKVAFPILQSQGEVSISKAAACTVDDSFFESVRTGKGESVLLDDYLSLHVGQPTLLKIGGSGMQHTRRLVLASLIQHSGTFPLCSALCKELDKDLRDINERPLSVLIDIWKGLQRVLERIIRLKQESGLTYEVICGIMCQKAELLSEIEPSYDCVYVRSELELIDSTHLLTERHYTESGAQLIHKCSALVTEVIEFFLSPMKRIESLRGSLLDVNCSALMRIAAFRSLQLLTGKLDKALPASMTLNTSNCSVPVLSKMLVWLPVKFNEKIEMDQRNYNLGEHYLAGLMGLSAKIALELKVAFEHLYELIAQHITRSMWVCDPRGQTSALAAWNIIVHPEDHMFFNRINLFKVFHGVLEQVRKLVFLPSSIELSLPTTTGEKTVLEIAIKSALGSIAVQSRRLANLVLTTVHCLAVQVASVREGLAQENRGVVGMQRAHSGPDTLSRSLFDLMYAELKNAVKCILPASGDNNSKLAEISSAEDVLSGIDSLEGEDYICRILRLLRLVSDSKVCQKQLSSHKWLSLLLSLVGYGSIGVQRRVLRLLHRLLVSIDPILLTADVPAVFIEQASLAEPIMEEDEEVSSSQNSAAKLLVFLFRCLSVVFPGQRDKFTFIKKLVQRGMADALAAEALLLLRVLYGIPAWRKLICTHLERSLDCFLSPVEYNDENQLEREISLVSSCALIGGFMERLRPGGFVMLKPFCLLGSSDNYATKLAAAYHTCGMLVSQSAATSSVEVVLMERNVKLSKIEQGQVLVQHTLSLAGSLPIRSVRLTATDVLPCADLPFVASLLPPDLVRKLWRALKTDTLNWLSNKEGSSDASLFDMYAHIVKLRAFATCIQSNSFLDQVLEEDAEMFSILLECSANKVQSFSLATLEASVDYINDLFNVSEAIPGGDDAATPPDKPSPKPPSSDLHLLRRAEASSASASEQSSSSPLRDFVAMLSPYGGLGLSRASQPFVVDADALAQMLEIGLPREWCEFALKRCQNSVEMAINLCLEHGGDMDRLIAQDAAVEASRAQRESASATLGPRRAFGRLTASLEAQSLRREDRSNAEGPSTSATAPVEAQAMIRQLLDMGFPPSWCIRAIESNQNNLDAALGWILTHDEELMISSREGCRKTENKTEEGSEEIAAPVFNPLVMVSGSCDIRPDLTCSTQSGFPSVGCRSHPISSGKWYYELTVHTAGCVQVGWAATGYQGAADNGQGVGDDLFSWAFDGWRTYLWHETCVEWGTRWAPGDVVGCAVDLDNRTMSFFLNGFGEEVGMGLAFTQFDASYDLHLELFPCASFNRNEKVKFNFGSTPFRYEPPPGYRPYLDNMNAGDEQFNVRKNENALEEFREEKVLKMKKLFVEEVRFSSEHTSFFYCTKNRRIGIDEVKRCVLDVGTLYTRLITLRCLRKFTTLNEGNRETVVRLTFSTSDKANSSNNMEALMKLLQVASCASTRTKVFLLAKQILPPHQCPPQNLGSTFSIGGVAALEELRESVLYIMREALVGSSSMLRLMLEEIRTQVQISASRANIDYWKACSQVVPVVFLEASTISDEKLFITPSLLLAAWLTSVCIQSLNRLFAEDKSVEFSEIMRSLTSLVDSWVVAVQSPSSSVKLCGVFVLSVTMEDILVLRKRDELSASKPEFNSLDSVLLRLKQQAVNLMAQERAAAPVYSTYLQHLLELISASSYHGALGVPSSPTQQFSPFAQLATEDEDVHFSWEGVSGRLLADKEGWQTWSGKVNVQALDLRLPVSSYRYRGIERQDFPPELMPGCKVAKRTHREGVAAGEAGKDGEMHRWMRDSMSLSPSDSISRLRMIFERNGQGEATAAEKSSGDTVTDVFDQIGTVKSISDWPNDCVKGRARIVVWDDGSEETVRWGAEGIYDVHHVSIQNGKVLTAHPYPPGILEKLSQKGFGAAAEYGVLVKFRRLPGGAEERRQVGNEVVCIVEWPDFASVVLATGYFVDEATVELVEKSLLRGSRHSGWERLRGMAHWEAGSVYRLTASHDVENAKWRGMWEHTVVIQSQTYRLQGEVELQQARLFVFDAAMHAPNVLLSRDLVSACKSGGSQGCAFGNVGFSQGVHVWELKVEQADVGSVFIGIAEKTADLKGGRLGRWTGMGLVNNRVSYRSSSSLGERGQVYGDHFHSGDLVCVVLDLNAGKLSFFLDGMKYGEHAIADLGEAFDNLVTAQSVKPRVYFPIVGLSKNVDRVTISPRWLSSVGISEQEELSLYQCSYQLFSSWNAERSKAEPLEAHRWIYREGWRNFHSMSHSTALRVRCRSASTQLSIALDTSYLACLEASLHLGLLRVLLPGDRVAFTKSSGRVLSSKEEAVILGAYQRTLWYKLDAQASSGSNTADNTASIWSLLPSDIEGLRVARLGGSSNNLADSGMTSVLHNATLPRLTQFRGGLISILHDGGAVMRDGLEIDHSEVLCTVPKGATLYALERRVNASNIMRFLVYYNGRAGWISERMRGGAEDVMVQAYDSGDTTHSAEELQLARQTALSQCKNPEHAEKLNAPVADTAGQAVDMVLSRVDLPLVALRPTQEALSFDTFRALASTADDAGRLHWTVEMDMQLCEMASRHATKVGIDPSNFTRRDGELLWQAIQTDIATLNGTLRQVGLERLIARLCILRAANAVIFCTLPFFQLVLPEERLGNEEGLPEHAIDTISNLPNTDAMLHSSNSVFNWADVFDSSPSRLQNKEVNWAPSCIARKMRSLRRLLFSATKQTFWDSLLNATITPTALHQDEYEDPREIKLIRVNRVKATLSKLASVKSSAERVKQSVFGQLHKEMRSWPASQFRRAYVGKGHGGQRRAFKVKFLGEGVNDYGGPYRAVFEQVVDELQCDAVTGGTGKVSDKCLLPLLLPCPNKVSSVGSNQDKFLFNSHPSIAPMSQEFAIFLGRLVGMAVRHHLHLALDLSLLVWRPLVKLPLSLKHLATVDSLAAAQLEEIVTKGTELEEAVRLGAKLDQNFVPEEWSDLTFTAYLPDGSRLPLVTGGLDQGVNLGNWRNYVALVEQARLQESAVVLRAFREGLASVLPVELFPLFTPSELEHMICGSREVDIDAIWRSAEYEGWEDGDELVQSFWSVLKELSSEEKTLFLRFVWARSRLPSLAKELPINFKLQMAPNLSSEQVDQYLPHAQTCFFSLSLPHYSSRDILKEKLLYAIKNSPNMDADVRLHNAEGWADA